MQLSWVERGLRTRFPLWVSGEPVQPALRSLGEGGELPLLATGSMS